MPPDVLGHLMHRLQLQRPQELWMVMSEMSLGRVEQLLLGIACELRPALAKRGPTVFVRDYRHMTLAVRHLVRPSESVSL